MMGALNVVRVSYLTTVNKFTAIGQEENLVTFPQKDIFKNPFRRSLTELLLPLH